MRPFSKHALNHFGAILFLLRTVSSRLGFTPTSGYSIAALLSHVGSKGPFVLNPANDSVETALDDTIKGLESILPFATVASEIGFYRTLNSIDRLHKAGLMSVNQWKTIRGIS
jgi:hypothetical protein